MRARLLAGTAAATLALAVVAAGPASAADDAQLSVLHGVPGLTVDVYVNGDLTLDDFEPGKLAGPLPLAAGTYTVAITAADAKDDSDPAIGPVDLDLAAGKNYTAVAHLDAEGKPTATLFTNDTSTTKAGEGRITVRHVAAAPGVDVLAGKDAVITNLENPDEKVLDLPAGTVSASVVATGTTEPALLGPADVDVAEGTNTILYAWGDATADPSTLALATQVIDGLHGDPSGVQAGELGLVSDEGSAPVWPYVLGAFAAFAVAALAVVGRRRSDASR
jgi:MYXO-CTERM domain-containing protein